MFAIPSPTKLIKLLTQIHNYKVKQQSLVTAPGVNRYNLDQISPVKTHLQSGNMMHLRKTNQENG